MFKPVFKDILVRMAGQDVFGLETAWSGCIWLEEVLGIYKEDFSKVSDRINLYLRHFKTLSAQLITQIRIYTTRILMGPNSNSVLLVTGICI